MLVLKNFRLYGIQKTTKPSSKWLHPLMCTGTNLHMHAYWEVCQFKNLGMRFRNSLILLKSLRFLRISMNLHNINTHRAKYELTHEHLQNVVTTMSHMYIYCILPVNSRGYYKIHKKWMWQLIKTFVQKLHISYFLTFHYAVTIQQQPPWKPQLLSGEIWYT